MPAGALKEQTALRRSNAGFELGHTELLGCYSSTVRQKNEANGENPYIETEEMNLDGKEYVEILIKNQEKAYNKKFAYERSKFV